MNLFRSEEHARTWSGFKSGTEGGIVPVAELVQMFSGDLFRRRLDPDYISHGMYFEPTLKVLAEFGKTHPFWAPAQR